MSGPQSTDLQHHINCRPGDVARYVLLPGDPGRAHMISTFFENPRLIAEHREYVTYTGTVDGVPISVCSTGIGCPSTAIAVEELARVGADTFIRVGTAGGMQPECLAGDLVVASAAIRDEGTTRQYMPMEFPAVASLDVTNALAEAAEALGQRYHVGVCHSKDSFYGQHQPERMPIARTLEERWNAWIAGGCLASEMEASAIYVVSSYLRKRAGCVLLVAGNQIIKQRVPEDQREAAVGRTIQTAIEAVKLLAARDHARKA